MKNPLEDRADYSRTPANPAAVPDRCAGRRLDQVLAELWPQHSRNRLQGWVREGLVEVDGKVEQEPKRKLLGGERLRLNEPREAAELAEQPEDIPLDIVFEDEALLVINKPAGLVVHPGSGNWSGTLMNALLHHVPAIAEVPRAGIVHRLDKDTSGLLVVAKTLEVQTDLVRQLQARTVKRQYLAFVAGVVFYQATIDAPIGRHPAQRVKMAVVPETRGGKAAVTHYRGLEQFAHCALIECTLETGRTHQIRVHMASVKHPLIGDKVYGRPDPRLPAFPRQALHATRLALVHPLEQRLRQWEVPLPADMAELLETLRYE
ncbi:23S rRNA pseudouridine(1911/1915/1917) synthase RluD [Dechloromonas sp. H13]|uniref:23S rRNA pseudouridine(1911/1915/1917) synthase RluD n=1 Tax=Dechloromonas sp. H13 TaxID=2570193 RepID=UPI00129218FD|nr:23S rRNA pseudouridine(1911/1915/1917) synthase RluD [Dechloromonas sp. H13]